MKRLLLIGALFWSGCDNSSDLSGNGSETTNGVIAGQLLDTSGSTIAGAKISFYPQNYHAGDSVHNIVATTSDDSGFFKAELTDGEYHLVSVYDSIQGVRSKISFKEKLEVGALKAHTLGQIKGVVPDSSTAWDIYLVGSDQSIQLEKGKVNFAFSNIPRGNYDLELVPSLEQEDAFIMADAPEQNFTINVTLRPETDLDLKTIQMGPIPSDDSLKLLQFLKAQNIADDFDWRGRVIIDTSGIIRVDLSDLELKIFGPEIALLNSFGALDLRRNQISQLPDEFWTMDSIQSIQLGHNMLSEIPTNIANMKELVYFGAEKNQIHSLSGAIASLPKLESLFMGYNQIDSIPPEIGAIPKLTNLGIQNNLLQNLPDEIRAQSLNYLDISNNKLCTISSDLSWWLDIQVKGYDWRHVQTCN